MSRPRWISLGALISALAIVFVCWWALRKETLYDLHVQFAGSTRSWSITDDDDYSHARSQVIAGILAQKQMLADEGGSPVIYGHFQTAFDLGMHQPRGMAITSQATAESPRYLIRRKGQKFTSGAMQGQKWIECATGDSLEFVVSEALTRIHSNLQHSKKALQQANN